jgi:hypothetical protein
VDRRDLLSIVAALIVVSVVAVLFQTPPEEPLAEGPGDVLPGVEATPSPSIIPSPAPTPLPSPAPLPEPTRIHYTTAIWDYPCCYLPDNLTYYGGSDPLWKSSAIIPFAYIEEERGGITEVFHVPYAVWRLNCSVSATIRPEAAHFRMALVDLASGNIVEGAELRYPGTIIKNVQRGGKDFYLIVSVQEVDSYCITLETLPEYLCIQPS